MRGGRGVEGEADGGSCGGDDEDEEIVAHKQQFMTDFINCEGEEGVSSFLLLL